MAVTEPDWSAENKRAASLFESMPSRYDLHASLLSFGMERGWRTFLVKQVSASQPTLVLDVATGTGAVAIEIARQTRARVTGVDITESMLQQGRERVRAAGLEGRIALQLARAEALPFPDESFDALTFTYLLRYVRDPEATLRELARVVRPGGVVASLEFFVPPNAVSRVVWRSYMRLGFPAAGALIGGRAFWRIGRFLAPNIEAFYARWPIERIKSAWQGAGIGDVSSKLMGPGTALVMWGTKGKKPAVHAG